MPQWNVPDPYRRCKKVYAPEPWAIAPGPAGPMHASKCKQLVISRVLRRSYRYKGWLVPKVVFVFQAGELHDDRGWRLEAQLLLNDKRDKSRVYYQSKLDRFLMQALDMAHPPPPDFDLERMVGVNIEAAVERRRLKMRGDKPRGRQMRRHIATVVLESVRPCHLPRPYWLRPLVRPLKTEAS